MGKREPQSVKGEASFTPALSFTATVGKEKRQFLAGETASVPATYLQFLEDHKPELIQE